ncbi:signal peptidase I [Gordonibacter sp. An230]|uniref:signal peptidase I n=1 Tax=Gordonibacter sp. An230 TaxID=1965592 RepID=UPI000B38B26C|nr:signal peptidase I [Gordonibacter sp. An230]OUO90732.1 signal peptidase I [Gordonibacter sp. An230]
MNSGKHVAMQRPALPRRFLNSFAWLGFVALLSWLTLAYVGRAYAVPSGSMEETIMTGDMVFAEKVSYLFRDPEPGDIVTFKDPEIPGRILIKRCIAVGGQTVDINDEDGLVYVDGEPLSEPYVDGKPSYRLAGGVVYPYTVPEGHVWVMGDNRTNSQDSRFFGAVPVSTVEARGLVVLWPFDEMRLLS